MRCYTSWWNNVVAAGTVSVTFAEASTARGTPELWLAQYGWTNDFDSCETNDPDSDLLKNWEEYIAGTDPTSSTSVFKCVEITPTNSPHTGKSLRWDGTTGRVYAVQSTTNLTTSSWIDLATNLPPDGLWTDTNSVDGVRYYRLKVQQAP